MGLLSVSNSGEIEIQYFQMNKGKSVAEDQQLVEQFSIPSWKGNPHKSCNALIIIGVFKLPKDLCKEIFAMISRFWWGHKHLDERILVEELVQDMGTKSKRRSGIQRYWESQQSYIGKTMLENFE